MTKPIHRQDARLLTRGSLLRSNHSSAARPPCVSILAPVILGLSLLVPMNAVAASAELIPPSASQRVGQVLAERHVDQSAKWPGGVSRGLRDIFRDCASAVPFVIARRGTGSSVVVHVDRTSGSGFLVTNHHVVESAFINEKNGVRFVVLVFYEPALATGTYDPSRVAKCLTTTDESAWCATLRGVTRPGVVVASDPGRDLALVAIQNVPGSVRPIPSGTLDAVRSGDDVIVIGHPLGYLWSITTGIVSAIRSNFPMSPSSADATVVQTQTPINPGNSGGPLLTSDGQLIGVIFGARTVRAANQNPDANIRVPASGINFAIGVNDVQDFVSKPMSRPR